MELNQSVLLIGNKSLTSAEFLSLLSWAGFVVDVLQGDEDLLKQIAEISPEILVVDVSINPASTRALLQEFHDVGFNIPVLLVGDGGPLERALALDRGADDYINKPFNETELISRIRSVLRRSQRPFQSLGGSHRLACYELSIDRLSRRAWLEDEEVILTPKAFSVLEYLMIHPDQLLTRDTLLDAIWGWESLAGIRAVDTRIFELRKALNDTRGSPRFIETVSGMGYRFVGTVAIMA
jgi:DNA-binding response OmpR family regulator